MKHTKKYLLATLLCGQALVLGGCGGSSSSSGAGGGDTTSLGLPTGLHLSLLNASNGAYYHFDTSTEKLTDLNEIAAESGDSAIQKLQITDTSTIGHFLHWPDFRVVNEEERLDMKYLLMRPDYAVGNTIDADHFVQLAHFHGDTLAAHSADEFSDPEPGGGKEAALARLNSFVATQQELEDEMGETMTSIGETLCRAYVDPYLKFELEDGGTEEGHEHDELTHFALSDSGRIYFFGEGENGLEQTQPFVKLDDVSSITDCSRTTIARASEDGVLVFVPETQRLYLVDNHGGDYHQHSSWTISAILGEGTRADLIAVIGEGEGHDHEHEEEYEDDHG